MLASAQSDYARARAMFEEALATRLDLGELEDAAATLNQLGLIGLDTGDLDEAPVGVEVPEEPDVHLAGRE